MEKQVSQALDRVEAVFAEAGLTLADVVKYDLHTTDVDAYLPASGALAMRFAAVGNAPVGSILAEVRRLAFPQMLVEITCTAAR